MGGKSEEVPVIDLAGVYGPRRSEIAKEVLEASEEWGFFTIVNHGIPSDILDEIVEGIRRFIAADKQLETKKYSCYNTSKVQFQSELYMDGSYPNWRESLVVEMAPDPPSPEEIPAICRDILIEYVKLVTKVAEMLYELLSESLGLQSEYFKKMECMNGLRVICHSYPPCPKPEMTMGTNNHTDPCFLTLLLQDMVGGLQILHKDAWVDVPPFPGALVVNNGDFLQLMSNDRLKSIQHRVLARKEEERISVASFFSGYHSKILYGPIKELISEENPAIYKETSADDYFVHFLSGAGNFATALDYLKV